MSVWAVMIIVHGAAAVVALVASILLLSLRRVRAHAWMLPVLLVALLVMIIGMVGATVSHWTAISSSEQIIFIVLALLATLTLFMGWRAKQTLAKPEAYTNHIGFVWIVQLEGLIILAPLGLGAPAWVTAIVAIVTLVLGIWVAGIAKRRNLSARG